MTWTTFDKDNPKTYPKENTPLQLKAVYTDGTSSTNETFDLMFNSKEKCFYFPLFGVSLSIPFYKGKEPKIKWRYF